MRGLSIIDEERFKQPPAAILFDTDNTLYPYDPAHEAAMAAVEEKVCKSLNLSRSAFSAAFKTSREEVKARLAHTASSHSRLLYFQRMLELLGLGSQVLLALDFEQTYWRVFLSNSELFNGVVPLLEAIRQSGIPCAIVTDLTAQIQFRKIVYFGLDHYFDYIVSSEEAGFDKPHPAPFKLALAKLAPKTPVVWMIGDNPKNDILGAKQAFDAVAIQKIHAGVELGVGDAAPHASFSDFTDLERLFRRLAFRKETP